MRLKRDITVNAALNSAISRDSKWSHKKSTVVPAEAAHTHAMNKNCPTGEMPAFPDKSWEKESTKLTLAVKASVKSKIHSDTLEEQKKHLDTLLKQGHYLKFA